MVVTQESIQLFVLSYDTCLIIEELVLSNDIQNTIQEKEVFIEEKASQNSFRRAKKGKKLERSQTKQIKRKR